MGARIASLAALGLALSCGGMTRNSDLGGSDAGIDVPEQFGECTCRGGLCCGELCCDLTETCCLNGPVARCLRSDGVNDACAGF